MIQPGARETLQKSANGVLGVLLNEVFHLHAGASLSSRRLQTATCLHRRVCIDETPKKRTCYTAIHAYMQTHVHMYRRIHTCMHALHCTALYSIPFHYMRLDYIRVHWITSDYIRLHYTITLITLHHMTSHYIISHYITIRCIALQYIAFHCNTLHCITLHYITLHYSTDGQTDTHTI